MRLVDVLPQLIHHPTLNNITLDTISRYTRLVLQLKDSIILTQPLEQSSRDVAPDCLPPSIGAFLGDALGFTEDEMDKSWAILKDYVWSCEKAELTKDDYEAFKEFGWVRGVTAHTVYPPNDTCTFEGCPNKNPLKKETSRRVLIYTVAHGVQPAWAVHLYCTDCNTAYHNNFSVSKGQRTYYAGIPDFLQVGEHQFVEKTIVNMWTGQLLLGWVSASNSAKLYEMVLSNHGYLARGEWQFVSQLNTDHVWDSVILLALLRDKESTNSRLEVPHGGKQKDRFTLAMEERNKRIIHEGQPDAVRHACDKCLRIYVDGEGAVRTCQVIVGDGLSMGRPCCGIFRCTEALQNNRHRFCKTHFKKHDICAIVGCEDLTSDGSKTCSNKEHKALEKKNKERGAAAFTLKERLRKTQFSHPTESISITTDESLPTHATESEWFDIDADGNVTIAPVAPGSVGVADDTAEPCPSKSGSGNRKIKAQFGRRRTHNEQTLVRPCGIIFARATFFGAEAVSNFLVMCQNAFSVPGARKPDHIFYDTNCDARQQARLNYPWFNEIEMCVDVWHFLNKHQVTHEYCQKHCNPAMYKELLDEIGRWFFNTSVAEQTNAWLQGYHSICREMLPAKYDFFLDEMIRLRNLAVLQRLKDRGHNPREL